MAGDGEGWANDKDGETEVSGINAFLGTAGSRLRPHVRSIYRSTRMFVIITRQCQCGGSRSRRWLIAMVEH